MRLIDANDVKKRSDCYPPTIRDAVAHILRNTKTVKDAALIVHCKDCENWDTDWTSERTKGLKTEYHYCPMVDSLRPADWFCGDGKRRDNG